MFLLRVKRCSKLSRDFYLGGARVETMGCFLPFHISSFHNFTFLAMIINQEMMQSFLFFNRLLFSRHSILILLLQFPPKVQWLQTEPHMPVSFCIERWQSQNQTFFIQKMPQEGQLDSICLSSSSLNGIISVSGLCDQSLCVAQNPQQRA